MGSVAHSGNYCHGLCATPCGHDDCWQCVDHKDAAAVKYIRERIDKRLAVLTKPTIAKFAIPAPAKAADQKAMITRGALEALAEKAGIRMNWNNGQPEFFDDSVLDREKRYADAERKVLEDKVAELSKIAAQQSSGILSQQAANSMAKAAAQQMDQTVSDILKAKVEETLVADAVANEATAIAKLKAGGASDADIEAAKELMGWRPPSAHEDDEALNDRMKALFAAGPVMSWDEVNNNGSLTVEDIQRAMDSLKRANVAPGPGGKYIGIVHPNSVEQMIREKMEQALTTKLPHLDPNRYRDLKFPGE